MVSIRNVAKDKLEAGDIALGVGLRQARTVDTAKIMKECGFDWLFIDMEHGTMDLDTAVQNSVAAQPVGITPIVRVPGFQHYHATRILDGGAQGIVVPHVDDAATAARMVSQCRYPPVGHRSVTGGLPQLDFKVHPMGEAPSPWSCRITNGRSSSTQSAISWRYRGSKRCRGARSPGRSTSPRGNSPRSSRSGMWRRV